MATLRGICARYIEGHVGPVLQELLRSQQQVEMQLESLAQTAMRKAEHREVEERLNSLMAKCSADLADLAAKVEHVDHPPGGTFGSCSSLEELRQALGKDLALKANLSEVPTLEQFSELAADVDRKANINQVPAVAQLQRIAEKVERKANTSRVPSLTQFQELSALVESKANMSSVPSVSQFDEFCGTIDRKIGASNLVSPAQIQKLSTALERKADADQVPTIARVEELGASVEARAVANTVPTLSQFKALATRVDRNEQDVKARVAAAPPSCNTCAGGGGVAVPASSNGSNGSMGANGGMPCGNAANVVWLVPAPMDGQWDSGYGQPMGCSGMWAPSPQGADCQQWRPQPNGLNGTPQ